MEPRGKAAAAKAVVVTGLGCVTPIGNCVASFWRSLLEGRSGAAPIASFATSPYKTSIGCEVKGFEAPAPNGGRWGRATDLAIAAAGEALRHAGIDPRAEGPRMGVSVGTTMGEPNFLDELTARAGGPPPSPDGAGAPWGEVLTHSAWSITSWVASQLGIEGPQASLPAACSAGNYAVGLAFDLIRQGRLEAAVAGGTEAFSESAFAGFSRLNAMSPDACRPFDADRLGLLLGEGAGFLVLECEEHARRRDAPVLARVLGYGLSCDAYHITGPHPEGEGAAAVMRNALRDAGADPGEVGYICCHGTGTPHNDRTEAKAIHKVFGDRARSVPASSIKAITGHMMGAASAAEAVACVLALRDGVLPPTWNHRRLDPECDLDVIPNEPREARVKVVLNNSYAFGGNNACVAFGER
ncbi:MAG: beta-ketoacyl-[acyl-carrier-protein] synthase family protein [Planctomycetes bacterium]|nr:beta-ketoacyl-[acyl-carrier-protein] synthase family protein [Planctomycetota bacterium]